MIAAVAVSLVLAATPSPDGDADALAVEISRLVITTGNYQAIVAQAANQASQMATAAAGGRAEELGPGFQAELRAGVAEMMSEVMPSYQDMVDMQAGLLVKHYTAEELRGMLDFYRTPLGQKVIRVMPQVSADVMGWMMSVLQERMPAASARFEARLKDWKKKQDVEPTPDPR